MPHQRRRATIWHWATRRNRVDWSKHPAGNPPVWQDKRFWRNIRVGDYQLPPDALAAKVHRMIEDGAVEERLLAFEVSEQYPANWADSMMTVLNAIDDHSG